MKLLIVMLICLFASLEYSSSIKAAPSKENKVTHPLENKAHIIIKKEIVPEITCQNGEVKIINTEGKKICVRPLGMLEECDKNGKNNICDKHTECTKENWDHGNYRCDFIIFKLNQICTDGDMCDPYQNLDCTQSLIPKEKFKRCNPSTWVEVIEADIGLNHK